MSEENSYIPSLTLEPNAQAVAAVAEEAKEEEKVEDIPIERLELSKLSPVRAFLRVTTTSILTASPTT